MKEQESLKGDKLRDLLIFVYLSNKYGRSSEFKISELKRFIGYSAGGIYSALDSSGYFIRNGREITLSKKGEKYVKDELMTSFNAIQSVSYLVTVIGCLLLLHWYLFTYHDTYLVFEWNVGLVVLIGGLVLRFCLPLLTYIGLIIKKKFKPL